MKASEKVLAAQMNLIAEEISMQEVGDYDVPGFTMQDAIDEDIDTLVKLIVGDLGLLVETARYFTDERPDLVPGYGD